MDGLPEKLKQKLIQRKHENAMRTPSFPSGSVDFSSNDYLGLAQDLERYQYAHQLVLEYGPPYNGSTGSRLLTGHQALANEVEADVCEYHGTEAALLYSSGYIANLGLLSAVAQKEDIILYDRLSHASIREGIRLSLATGIKYGHLDLDDLERKIKKYQQAGRGDIFIVTESVFSMDGDMPDLMAMIALAEKHNAYLIVDEAHALGVVGDMGQGLVSALGLQNRVFATVLTFGKAAGAHGAAILGSNELRTSLLNFSRSQIYTTALSPHSLATLKTNYAYFGSENHRIQLVELKARIAFFRKVTEAAQLSDSFVPNGSHIQACIVPGNEVVKKVARSLGQNGFDVRPILSPTVPEGLERLRICLHTYNQKEEIETLISTLKDSLQHGEKEPGIYHNSRV